MVKKDDLEKFLIECYESGTLENSLEVKNIDRENELKNEHHSQT